jgi:hypothetical protein
VSAPLPDRRPQLRALAAGSEDCGCCDGIAAETPQTLDNRGDLSAVAYRIGDYAQFRASLHAALSSSTFGVLAELRTRDDHDFTLGLIDAFACAADVLTFYQERIANESYLRTALERVSLQELGKLVGYRLRPGVAAEGWLAFALEAPPKPPSTLAPEPGSFVTGVETRIALDAGIKVQSVPGSGETPQTFETVESLAEARPAWNAIRPWFTESLRPGRGATHTYLAGVRNNLRTGDALIFLGDEFLAKRDRSNWDFRVIDSVEPQSDAGRTLVRWKRGLGSLLAFTAPNQHPQVHALRKRVAVFGNNAPGWTSLSDAFRTGYLGGRPRDGFGPQWPNFELSPYGKGLGADYVDLDSVVPELQSGSFVVLAQGAFNYASEPAPPDTHVELYEVIDVAEISRAEFGLSGKVTRVQVRGDHYEQFKPFVRETSVFAVSERLELADHPVTDAIGGERIPLACSSVGFLPGRRLIVRGALAGEPHSVVVQQATLRAVHSVDETRCELEITPALRDPLARDGVVVHANVALASHGETVTQVLGAGDAAAAFQRFALAQVPLSYRAAANELGAASELTVRIGDVAWSERATLFAALPNERAYALATDAQARQLVVFGDGVRGARAASGVNNVSASYRKGLGVSGNVGADKLTQLIARPLGVKSVSNALAAEGGTDPERAESARESIPLTARTLGRVVSLLDYEDFARAFSGIAKAQARVLQLNTGPTIAITLAGPSGARLTPASPVWLNLMQALRACGDPHVAVQLLACELLTFQLGLTVKCDPAYHTSTVLSAVESALRAHFAFDARALAQAVQESDVIAVAQAVPGVVALDITELCRSPAPLAQSSRAKQTRLLASGMRVQGGRPLPAELLTLDPLPLNRLEEMR